MAAPESTVPAPRAAPASPLRDALAPALAWFDELPTGLWVFDGSELRLAAANRVALAMIGDRAGALGTPLCLLLPELAGQELVERVEEVYATGRPIVNREWRALVDTDGDGELEELHVAVSIAPWRGPGDEVAGVVAQTTDVTAAVRERRAAAAELDTLGRRYAQARDVVSELQRSLLPAALPVLPGVRLAARYLAAGSEQAAGGDWFDAIPLGGGRLALVVGDVVGHGAAASAVMGRLRAVLTEYLLDGMDLVEAVARLDRFAERVPEARATTLALAVLDPATTCLRHVSCGHPAPLVVGADGAARVLPSRPGGPLGVPNRAPAIEEITLRAGDVVLLYSDGLVERAGTTLAEGVDTLRRAAAAAVGRATPELLAAAAADRICELVVERLARTGFADDVTVLAAELCPVPGPIALTVPAVESVLPAVRGRLAAWLATAGVPVDDVARVQLAADEAVVNAIEHAYPDVDGTVRVEAVLDHEGRAVLTVSDSGRWRQAPPDVPRRGRGIMMMRGCMDSVEIEHTDAGTTVLMERTLRRPVVIGDQEPAPARPPARPADDSFAMSTRTGPEPVLAAHGALDVRAATAFRDALAEAGRGGAIPLTVDLAGVTLLSSAGVQALYDALESGLLGPAPRLIAPAGGPARQVISLVGLDGLVPVVDR